MHDEGMVHRDLKPGNVMLVPGGIDRQGAGPARPGDNTLHSTVKILDIGLGRALFDEFASTGGEDANLTADGDILGTPDYLAPEQAHDSHAADIRSDIYSLGCTLFNSLAGQPPFPDSNMVRKMVRHSTEPVPSLKKLNPAVPEDLQQIVNWMMAKDPAQRYPTPQRAAQALQVFLIAGTEAAPREVDGQMRAYLDWLATTHGEEEMIPPSLPAVPLATPVAPARSASPSMPPRKAIAGAEDKPAAQVIPVAAPVRVGIGGTGVPSVGQTHVAARKKVSLPRLSRRDAMMLSVGAGVLVATGGIIWLLKRVFGKK